MSYLYILLIHYISFTVINFYLHSVDNLNCNLFDSINESSNITYDSNVFNIPDSQARPGIHDISDEEDDIQVIYSSITPPTNQGNIVHSIFIFKLFFVFYIVKYVSISF